MSTIKLDGLNEEEFRRSIEMRLRHNLSRAALERLRFLIAPYAVPGGILPERFMTVTADAVSVSGWDGLAGALDRLDQPGRPITALSVAFGWPGEEPPLPDDNGRLKPHIETGFFTDEAFPFSQSRRDDLLDGYSYHGCTWSDEFAATEALLSVDGIDDLHGALALLEARLLASEEPPEAEIRAGSLGACLLSVLLHQAVSERIATDGLPRPLCVLAGSNGVYPYFDAPVVGMPEAASVAEAVVEVEETSDRGVPVARYSSLLVASIPRARKRAVLVLNESEGEMAARLASLRGLHHRDEGDVPANPDQREAEAAILPAADGPLMARKNPSGKPWDFRDLLATPDGPQAADPPQTPAAMAESAENWPVPDTESEPELEAEPADRLPVETVPGPGFALLESNVQERLTALLAQQVRIEPLTAEAAIAETVEIGPPEPEQLFMPESRPAPPGHPARKIASPAIEARPGLWSGLREWVAGKFHRMPFVRWLGRR